LPVFMIFPLIWIVYIPLVGYGILRTQLFDIDIRLKRTVSRGTVAAIIVAIAFVVSELAAQLLSDRAGPFLGIAAAGVLVFAMAPLQRVADRLTNVAMPGVDARSPAYVTYRKMEVYRAALEGALEDGDVTQKERAMLARLRGNLDIGDDDARALEADVRQALRSAGAVRA
ncbi:MAG TPA: hypothetical protein VM582_01580, partial [Candidatus Thermoplasmatota archaeon]|nr:hypothetical protein [Candidatus Thermoplasmatota archaeon]